MSALNADAASAALEAGARAATDVTGFGLLGHLHSMALHSGVAAELQAAEVPCLVGVEELLRDGHAASGGSRRNLAYAEQFASFAADVPAWRRWLTCDATTSGGLLISVAVERAGAIPGAVIGRIVEGDAGAVRVV
jgi:selenide,water dikinase